MASNDYYNPSPTRTGLRSNLTSPKPLPPDPYTAYNRHHTQPSPSYMSSSFEDTSYHPYAEQSHQDIPSPYYASGGGGREYEQNPYSDNIPLRQHPSKGDSDTVMHDPLPNDPTIIDRRSQYPRSPRQKQGFFRRKQPWVVYTFTLIQVIVFIAELAKNGKHTTSGSLLIELTYLGVLTKTPIEIHPAFNPMIGPSPYVLINMGARYVPCMRKTSQGLNDAIQWPCPNTTTTDLSNPSNQCKINQLCGFGDKPYTDTSPPHQWFRFIFPMFLHAGFIHIAFNMLLQVMLGTEMELEIGPIRFFLVYISSGIFGFVLGGNFAAEGIASTGASGSLFGVIALMLLDLFYHWGERRSPWVDLAWLVFDIVISFVLGLLPGLDNFSHIGGFLMGLVLGICILHSPDVLRARVGADLPPYASVTAARERAAEGGIRAFAKEPGAFFKGRKPLWWAWWLVRVAALIGVFIVFVVLLKNFYKANPTTCSWCKYLSCIVSFNSPFILLSHANGLSQNINHWCDIGQLTTTTQNNTSKRDIFSMPLPVNLKDML